MLHINDCTCACQPSSGHCGTKFSSKRLASDCNGGKVIYLTIVVVTQVVVVAFSSLARICGECSIIQSPLRFFF